MICDFCLAPIRGPDHTRVQNGPDALVDPGKVTKYYHNECHAVMNGELPPSHRELTYADMLDRFRLMEGSSQPRAFEAIAVFEEMFPDDVARWKARCG